MLTENEVRELSFLGEALGVPMKSSKDCLGLLVYVGTENIEQKCACRSLREAVSFLVAQASASPRGKRGDMREFMKALLKLN